MSALARLFRLALVAAVSAAGLFTNEAVFSGSPDFVSTARAVRGRPATPMSYAGVARRTTRRAVGAAVVTTPTVVVTTPHCVQVVDAYGRIVTSCH